MKGYPTNYVCAICSKTFTRRGSCERHRKNNDLDPTASVSFVDYIVGRLSGRYQPGDPSIHRRKYGDKKRQINDTFFVENSKRTKNAKVFPPRFTIRPDMTTEEYPQNIMTGSPRFNESHHTSAFNSAPPTNVKKKDRGMDAIEFCTLETSAVYQKDSSSSHEYSNDHLYEDSQKLREFTTLVRKYYSNSNADDILTYAKLLRGQVRDDWINSRLAILRDVDKILRLSQPR
jgi:hypothetical protein